MLVSLGDDGDDIVLAESQLVLIMALEICRQEQIVSPIDALLVDAANKSALVVLMLHLLVLLIPTLLVGGIRYFTCWYCLL